MNFWYSFILVQLKVALKSDFLKCPVSIWNDFTSNVDTLDRKSWILNADLWFQFKVKQKYDFLKFQKLFLYLYLFERNSLPKMWLQKCRGIIQKQVNFRCSSLVQHFSSKSRENWFFFWNVKSYSCIYLKWIHSKKVATEPLDRKR